MTTPFDILMLHVHPIHTFNDNFVWLLTHEGSATAAVVDPGEPGPVLATAHALGLTLTDLLITHKHADHIGGIDALKAAFPAIRVHGPANEPIPHNHHPLSEGDVVTLADLHLSLQVLDVPGHTEGHIAYYADHAELPRLFCGDTLFSIGCGRVMSGTFEQLHDSLLKLRALPDATQVYCAHEYTLSNIAFAKRVEPGNCDLRHYERHCHNRLNHHGDTVPSVLGLEKRCNPFLRFDQPSVLQALANRTNAPPPDDSYSAFRALRVWKDHG